MPRDYISFLYGNLYHKKIKICENKTKKKRTKINNENRSAAASSVVTATAGSRHGSTFSRCHTFYRTHFAGRNVGGEGQDKTRISYMYVLWVFLLGRVTAAKEGGSHPAGVWNESASELIRAVGCFRCQLFTRRQVYRTRKKELIQFVSLKLIVRS